MPANTEYLIAAYGIVISVVVFYAVGLSVKLKSVTSKLNQLKEQNKSNEE